MSDFSSHFFALQSPGNREYQEDDYGLLDARPSGSAEGEHTVIVVADGMGGHVGGALASKLATERFIEAYAAATGLIPQRLQTALTAANSALRAAIQGDPSLRGMGATLVAAVVHDAKLYWISVGDSPMWLLRDRHLQRLNANHSMAPVLQQMVADGRITQEQADNDPGRHSLLSALTGEAIELIDLSAEPLSLLDRDLLLVATDGLLTLTMDQITAILSNGAGQPVAELANRLNAAIEAAALAGQDNITIALYRSTRDRAAAIAVPPAIPVPHRTAVAGQGWRSWLLSVCVGLLIISGVLFALLNERDRATDTTTPVSAPQDPSGAEITSPLPDPRDLTITAPSPQPEDLPTEPLPESGEEPVMPPADSPVEDEPDSAKQPEADGVPMTEQDETGDEKAQ
jgi:protein phosphatase